VPGPTSSLEDIRIFPFPQEEALRRRFSAYRGRGWTGAKAPPAFMGAGPKLQVGNHGLHGAAAFTGLHGLSSSVGFSLAPLCGCPCGRNRRRIAVSPEIAKSRVPVLRHHMHNRQTASCHWHILRVLTPVPCVGVSSGPQKPGNDPIGSERTNRMSEALFESHAGRSRVRPVKSAGKSRITNGTAFLPGIDGRSAWIRRAKDLISEHLSDLGGADNTSAGTLDRSARGGYHHRARASRGQIRHCWLRHCRRPRLVFDRRE
jgi:hypothetical protein